MNHYVLGALAHLLSQKFWLNAGIFYLLFIGNYKTFISRFVCFLALSIISAWCVMSPKVLTTKCSDPVTRTLTWTESFFSFMSWMISRASWIVGHTLSWDSTSFGLLIFFQMSSCNMQRSSWVFLRIPLKFSKKIVIIRIIVKSFDEDRVLTTFPLSLCRSEMFIVNHWTSLNVKNWELLPSHDLQSR